MFLLKVFLFSLPINLDSLKHFAKLCNRNLYPTKNKNIPVKTNQKFFYKIYFSKTLLKINIFFFVCHFLYQTRVLIQFHYQFYHIL